MDITKSKEIETALRESENQLQTLNQTLEKRIAERTEQLEAEAEHHKKTQSELAVTLRLDSIGQLAGGVAHDFNNLLTVISGNLELAMQYVMHDESRSMITEAQSAVESGTNINNRLLSFALKQKLTPVRLSPNQRVMEMVHLLERTLGEDILISVKIDTNLWDTFIDPGEIDSALVNLAVNTRDAMPSGGELVIETLNTAIGAEDKELNPDAHPGDYVGLFVTDTGAGITPDVLDKVLEPFFTTKEQGKGTGLGLSSVYGFVEQSGGFLTIDSEVGKGTTIRLYLPRACEQAEHAPATVTQRE